MNKIRHDIYTLLAVLFTALSLAFCYFIYDAAYEDVSWQESEEDKVQTVETLAPLPDWDELNIAKDEDAEPDEQPVDEVAAVSEAESLNSRIIIDAGHGGKDRGSTGVSKRLVESKVNLKVSQMLYERLEADEELSATGVKPYLIRSEDVLVDDQDRIYEASQGGAIFVSIHCASTSSGRKSDMSGAVIKYKAAQKDGSFDVASGIVAKLKEGNLNVRGPVVGDDEYILRNCPIPAVLVEMGYLTSDEDCKNLSSDKYLNSIVDAIFTEVKNESLARNRE